MKYLGTLIAVTDMEKSKRFYHDLFGLNVVADFGANVTLEGGVFLQTLDTWGNFIHGMPVTLGGHAGELYFEERDMGGFLAKLNTFDISYVHPPIEHAWGQRVVRFYDPDRHVIEVGEDMTMVVKRFLDSGMTVEETARRMDVPPSYVRNCLEPQTRGEKE